MDFKQLYQYTKDLHLLYVEDDKNLREETAEILQDFFKSVEVAVDGQEGLDKYRSFHQEHKHYVDIVLTDINMPNMDGISLSKAILKEHSYQSIFVVSAYNETEYLLQLINLGISGFILKPFQSQQLIKTLYTKAQAIHNEKLLNTYHDNLANLTKNLEKEIDARTKELQEQVLYDTLTGLYNRYALGEDLKREEFAMLALVDIDRLQFINDLYGVEVGNKIIQKVANILEDFATEHGCTLYRTSGDEFALTHQDIEIEAACTLTSHLSSQTTNLQLHIKEINQDVNVDMTIGMGLKDTNLLTHADIALKHAKENHQQYTIYNRSLNSLDKMKEIVEWKNKIEYAIAHDNIIPVFQPIVNAKGDILKYEALMRLRMIEEGKEKLISPYFFLDTAIKTKLYPQLSLIMIKATIESLKAGTHTLSVNLSYHDFTNADISELLIKELTAHDIGKRLIFEIVESENIGDYHVLQNFIEKFRPFGVRIAIDDFGSGFSSFQQIVETSPDYIKIDGSLIKNIDTDLSSLTIVKAILQFSQELGIQVIAEFVHAEHILDILQSLGIQEYQGFYFYEPMPFLAQEKTLEAV